MSKLSQARIAGEIVCQAPRSGRTSRFPKAQCANFTAFVPEKRFESKPAGAE
jgi:hypothetical protein